MLTILAFSTLILFDMIADVYTNLLGVIAVLIFWFVMSLGFYSRERLKKFMESIICKGCCKKIEDLEASRSSIIEMNNNNDTGTGTDTSGVR